MKIWLTIFFGNSWGFNLPSVFTHLIAIVRMSRTILAFSWNQSFGYLFRVGYNWIYIRSSVVIFSLNYLLDIHFNKQFLFLTNHSFFFRIDKNSSTFTVPFLSFLLASKIISRNSSSVIVSPNIFATYLRSSRLIAIFCICFHSSSLNSSIVKVFAFSSYENKRKAFLSSISFGNSDNFIAMIC